MTAFNRKQQCRIYFETLNIKNKEQSREHSTGKFKGNCFALPFTYHFFPISRWIMGSQTTCPSFLFSLFQFNLLGIQNVQESFQLRSLVQPFLTPFSECSEFCMFRGFKYLTSQSTFKGMFMHFFVVYSDHTLSQETTQCYHITEPKISHLISLPG